MTYTNLLLSAEQNNKQRKQYRWRWRIKRAIEQQFTQRGFIELNP